MKEKFLLCKHCGNLVGKIVDSGVREVCCGDPMAELVPNTVDASQEKHLPVAEVDGDKVKVQVGSAPHPMLPEHYITWIYLQTANGGQRKALKPGDQPEASFMLVEDKPVAVYAYCNLHGLWKTVL